MQTLVGFLNPTGRAPSALWPVYQSAAQMYLQSCDESGRISAFQKADDLPARMIRAYDDIDSRIHPVQRAVGDAGIFAFLVDPTRWFLGTPDTFAQECFRLQDDLSHAPWFREELEGSELREWASAKMSAGLFHSVDVDPSHLIATEVCAQLGIRDEFQTQAIARRLTFTEEVTVCRLPDALIAGIVGDARRRERYAQCEQLASTVCRNFGLASLVIAPSLGLLTDGWKFGWRLLDQLRGSMRLSRLSPDAEPSPGAVATGVMLELASAWAQIQLSEYSASERSRFIGRYADRLVRKLPFAADGCTLGVAIFRNEVEPFLEQRTQRPPHSELAEVALDLEELRALRDWISAAARALARGDRLTPEQFSRISNSRSYAGQ